MFLLSSCPEDGKVFQRLSQTSPSSSLSFSQHRSNDPSFQEWSILPMAQSQNWLNLITLFFLLSKSLEKVKFLPQDLVSSLYLVSSKIWYRDGISLFLSHHLCLDSRVFASWTVSQISSLFHRAIEGLIEIIIANICSALTCTMLSILFVISFQPYNLYSMAISVNLKMK